INESLRCHRRSKIQPDHAAVTFHLCLSDLVIRLRFKTWIIDCHGFRMRRQHMRYRICVSIMALHPKGECFDPSHNEPRDLGSNIASEKLACTMTSFFNNLAASDHHSGG